jgi:hypothetical protein
MANVTASIRQRLLNLARERNAHDFQFGVLMVHRGLYVAAPHRSHYGRKVADSH